MMSAFYLASPWYMAGLLTLAIPFLLLLTKAKSLHVTNFSSIIFLRSITEKASNMIQWKRLLLLAVRVLMLFALVMAFALPFFSRSGGFWGAPQTHLIFILDNSYSMGYQEDGKTLFENAKDRALDIAHENQKGKTWFSLYGFNSKLEPWLSKTTDQNRFTSELRSAKLSSQSTMSAGLFAKMRNDIPVESEVNTKVFILSDFSMRESQAAEQFETHAPSWCDGCTTQLVPVQPRSFKNISLSSLKTHSPFFLPGIEEKIDVFYQVSDMKDTQIKFNFWIDQSLIETKTVKLSEEPKGTVSFRFKFPAPGFFPVKVEAETDGLKADNVIYSVIPVQMPMRMLMIEPKDYDYPFESPYFYLTQVLQSSQVSDDEAKSWIQMTKIPLSELAGAKLQDYDWVMVADTPSLDPKQLTQLRYYLKEGGAVLFAMGREYEKAKDINTAYLNQFLGGTLHGPSEAGSLEPFRISVIEYQNPLFQIFQNGKKGNLSTAAFTKVMDFTPQENTAYKVLAWFDGRRPALTEIENGKGHLFIWASSFHQDWTDFPKNPLYVPFFFELIKYGALRYHRVVQPLYTGEAVQFEEAGPNVFKAIKVKTPADEEITLYRGNDGNLQSLIADMPGFYEWVDFQKEPAEKKWAIANVNPEEGRPGFLSFKKTEFAGEEAGKKSGPAWRVRDFFYKPFLYFVLIALFLEAWLANQFYKPQWA